MFLKSATVTVPVAREEIFDFLRTRYDSQNMRQASLTTKGYVPLVTCVAEEPNTSMAFRVPGRDPLLRIFIGGWTWGYNLIAKSDSKAEVTVWYAYGLFMALLGLGTVGHQAANEIVETVSALDALARGNG